AMGARVRRLRGGLDALVARAGRGWWNLRAIDGGSHARMARVIGVVIGPGGPRRDGHEGHGEALAETVMHRSAPCARPGAPALSDPASSGEFPLAQVGVGVVPSVGRYSS